MVFKNGVKNTHYNIMTGVHYINFQIILMFLKYEYMNKIKIILNTW